jgi:hypothetical protein
MFIGFFPAEATAYVLETTETGEHLHWERACIDWWISESGTEDVTFAEAQIAATASFKTWDELDEIFISFQARGLTCVDGVGFSNSLGAHNIVTWRDGTGAWPYTARVVGLTSLTYDTTTGVIVDADIELNSEDFTFAVDGSPYRIDLQQAVTHEVGHVLGLGHSEEEASVMYYYAGPGRMDKRILHDDDITAVSLTHGVADAPGGSCANQDAIVYSEQSPFCPEKPQGCRATKTIPNPWKLLLLGSFVLLGICRRRRKFLFFLHVLALAIISASLLSSNASAQTCVPYLAPSGFELHWNERDIDYMLDPNLLEGLELDSVETLVANGFEKWRVECLDINLDNLGYADCAIEDPDDGKNCIFWAHPGDEWIYPSHLIAVTLVHYTGEDGIIVDTDMVFNGTGAFSWSTSALCNDTDHDFLGTITHEIGHFLGLDHALTPISSMNAHTKPGDCAKRTLSPGDEECICAVYDLFPPVEVQQERADVMDASNLDAVEADVPDTTPQAPQDRSGCQTAGHLPWKWMWITLFWPLAMQRRHRRPALFRTR